MPSLQSFDPPEVPKYPPFRSKTSMIQIGYGLWVNLTSVSFGLALGFSSVAVPHFEANTKIKLTLAEGAWLTSVINLTQPVGCVLAGMMTDKFGRRIVLIIGQVPSALAWLVIGFATSAKVAIIGRVISGFAMGMVVGSPRTYVTEVTLPNMRAVIGAFSNLAISLGLALQAGLASICGWKAICFTYGSFSIALTIVNFFLPESPYYILLKEDNTNMARNCLKKFRAKNYQIDEEMIELIKLKETYLIRRISMKDRFKALFKPNACKPFAITLLYILFAQLSGVGVTTFWSIKILQESKLSVEAYTGNVWLGVTRVVGGITVVLMLYKFRKRTLALVSSIGTGGSYLILGIYLKYAQDSTVYPLMLYMAFLFFASLGHYALPLIFLYELVPLQIRGVLSGIAVSVSCFIVFGATESYPYVRQSLSLPDVILIFSGFGIMATVYLYLFLPDTRLSLQELENFYSTRSIIAVPCLAKLLKKQPLQNSSTNNQEAPNL